MRVQLVSAIVRQWDKGGKAEARYSSLLFWTVLSVPVLALHVITSVQLS